jgi:hypothetical protein
MWMLDAVAEWLQTGHLIADPGDAPADGDVLDFQEPPRTESLDDRLERLTQEAVALDARYGQYPG